MKKTGFTLVELVITITILVILSTVAFVSFQSYTQDSRDANRLSSLNEIQKGLTLSYSKNGSFPTPKNATTYTGGTISLLQGTLTQEILPELQSDPKDPLSKSSYTYSTTSDGEYFQIASDIENTDVLSQVSPQQTYAKVSSALVKGNYKFDPSLPSLVVIPTTSLTSSGIFSPDNCFVTNGGTNTIGNTTCTTKKQSLLKTTDSSLVGYWDMETLTGTQLLDLSGNGYNGVFSGKVTPPSLTGGYIGKGVQFSTQNDGNAILVQSDVLNKNLSSLTLSAIVSTPYFYKYSTIIRKANRSFSGVQIIDDYPFKLDFSTAITPRTYVAYFSGGAMTDVLISQSSQEVNRNKFYIYTMTFNEGDIKLYQNGNLISSKTSSNIKYILGIPSYLELGHGNSIGGYGDGWCTDTLDGVSNNNCFPGIIDEVKIYSRALSDKEIEQQAKILGF